ncbi:zinc finger protein Xfin-like [Dunckerocampus dactyliophorus]|uniref:zinc finger protein Xfin-like n=1 Tax=Dunckerocampus dactyliophorus TaxID=161453 RepID=UPI00240555C9|nr:zinc finger protein Xfin-like [Dunckerocampus dactyliophorus]
MSACCVIGCKNRHSSGNKLKFYRIPTAYRPFQANRRRLWLKVIKQVNGSTEELKENARICGAHFISGEASMDHDSPDFVPSVFTCVKQSPRRRNQSRRIFGRRKRRWRRHAANIESEEMPTKADEPEIQESSSDPVPMEVKGSEPSQEMQTPSSTTCSKAEETVTEEINNTDTERKDTTSTPFRKPPPGPFKFGKISPLVLLKRILAPSGSYLCELCDKNFPNVPQLVHHKRQHEEEKDEKSPPSGVQENCPTTVLPQQAEPSFPCNMCDRTFTDNHRLKRHKLLHVRDGRKCSTCGVLFCQLHRHTLFVAHRQECTSESEEHSSASESQDVPEPIEVVDEVEDFKSSWDFIPLLKNNLSISEAQAPTSDTEILTEIPLQDLCFPGPVLPEDNDSKPQGPDDAFTKQCLPPHEDLPPALQLFSHQLLTSAFFQVKRNYEYIFSKEMDVTSAVHVEENPCETEPDLSDAQNSEEDEKKTTAFDLQIVI